MSKIDDALSSTFGVSPSPDALQYLVPTVADTQSPSVIVSSSTDTDDVFTDATEALDDLIKTGMDSLVDIISIARTEESPRAFEVMNTVMTTLAALNMQRIEVLERKAKLEKLTKTEGDSTQPSSESTFNNNVFFVGTTNDLKQQLAKLRMEQNI